MGELCALPGQNTYQLGVAGDSFNTAVYLARSGLATDYLTCLGDDDVSATIMARLHEEGIGSELVKTVPGRQAGIYLVRNDPDGERHFTYWRERSAARQLFDHSVEIKFASAFYFTGITLAVCRSGIANLVHLLAALKDRSCAVYFDPNYRPALWDSVEQARQAMRQVLPFCNAVFPTLDDEDALWGIDDASACNDFYRQLGIEEVVVKAPDLTAHVWGVDQYFCQRAARVEPVDTTGAGDAFNAGYLSVRLTGGDVEAAVAAAQSLAASVVQHQGALIPRR